MPEHFSRDVARQGANVAFGMVLVALGILFFVGQYLTVDLGQIMWPFFVIIPGLAFFMAMVLVGKNGGGLAVPGSVITTIGLMLLYQNTFDQWQTWSYAWALIPTSVGIGLTIQGMWSERPKLRESGLRLAKIGAFLFIAFGAFFELVLNISGLWSVNQWVWPLLLIGAGIILLMRRVPYPSKVSL